MEREWLGKNRNAIAIIRKSSEEQSSISHETQESEIRAYCDQHGLILRKENIRRIVESAKDSEDRKKYAGAINSALANNIRHVLFYMYDREARNLTDAEKNAKLVRADLICLHYVREQKVLHKDSPSSDFFMRNIHVVMNTQFIETLRVKVVDGMKQKAAMGWYPSNNVPLGYVTVKIKDESGREKKRGATVGVDPNEKRVQWVNREFELRAKGHSFRDVRQTIIDEGFVPPEEAKNYHVGTIEQRLKNVFYTGRFMWRGIEYQGKHPVIVPFALFKAAQRPGRGFKRREFAADEGLFGGGWLKCGDCGCFMIYDPKKKIARTTGKVTTFHYYHCTNGRRVHPSQQGLNVSERKIWEQFEQAIDAISLTPKLAKEVAEALNDTQKKTFADCTKRVAELKEAIKALEAREDRAYDDMSNERIDKETYQRQLGRFRNDRRAYEQEIRKAQAEMDGTFRETATTTLELCKEAKSLYLSQGAQERVEFLKKLVSNPRLSSGTLEFSLKKPFGVLAEMNGNQKWCGEWDLNPHTLRHTPLKRTCLPIPPSPHREGQ